ncbi:MAG: hypothetical protein LBB86_01180 [Oscillospiraceae bacterium]|nr:hypothetical protein [Oscillospiraceae bacterium]
MSDKVLTKDSDALICVLYKAYLERRKGGTDKDEAKFFGDAPQIHETYMPKWSFDRVNEACFELKHAGYLDAFCGDNMVCCAFISDLGILYMENRFSNDVSGVLDFLAKIKGAIPFA